MEVIVINQRVVSEYLGFQVNNYDNLMKIPNCKKFIEENLEYFYSINPQDFIDFYKKTGIILEHFFLNNRYHFNAYGLKYEFPYKIYSGHLQVKDKENKVTIKNDILYWNDKEVRNIKAEIKNQKNRFSEFQRFNERLQDVYDNAYYYGDFETKKNDLIKYNEPYEDYFMDYKEIENTEQLVVTPYNDVFALTSDGILYYNNKVYSKNVEYIFEENILNKIIIYTNNNVEYLTANFGGPFSKRCDKILYNKSFLATLKDKELEILIKDDEEYIANKSHVVTLNGIDDIDYNNFDEQELLLTVGKEKIVFPLLGASIHPIT